MDRNILISIFLGIFLVDSISAISGGKRQYGSTWKSLVAIYNSRNDYLCTGSIISSTAAVTSASCLGYYEDFIGGEKKPSGNILALYVRTNNADRRNREGIHLVVELAKHPQWAPEKPDFDCAVIKTKTVFAIDQDEILRIPSDKADIYAGITVKILGWGSTRENFPNEYFLHEGHSMIISKDDCKEKYPDFAIDEGLFFCSHTRGSGACSGDDGGPVLTQSSSGNHTLVGIIGYRKGCGYQEYPDIHVNIASVKEFIKEQVPKFIEE